MHTGSMPGLGPLRLLALPLSAVTLMGTAWAGGSVAQAAASASTAPSENSAPSATTEPMARGLIVKTRTSGASVRSLVAASSAALAAQGEPDEIAIGPAIEGTTRLLTFAEPLAQSEAEQAAAVLEQRIDVEWAVPDLPRRITGAPVIPNDPSFGQQWDLWDSGRPDGGYSVKAPLVWGTTTGSSDVVVAIIDTGITDHPDLAGQLVPGYDFVSDPAMGNDGDGRDPDPADPGDWVDQADVNSGRFGSYCDSSWIAPSTWHGTHVAGTIGAIQDNAYGISGVAPGVKLQTVRALGKCGGYDFDITAAMTWAVGGSVSGIPDNPTPAKVINMSLGGEGDCLPTYQQAIDLATSKGAVVVVAAGNESSAVTNFTPANCPGVVAVAATSRAGALAYYSNYGVSPGQVALAAPGGDFGSDNGIYSTFNTGSTVPGSPTFGRYQGTSMATPHVAGAAALLYSLGTTGTAAVRAALSAAVQPFPAGSGCTTVACGAGILDLSVLASTTVPGAPSDLIHAQVGNTSLRLSWSPPSSGATPTGYDVQASTDDGASWYDETTSEDTSVTITLMPGVQYRFRVAATSTAGPGAWSAPTDVIELRDVTVPGAPTDVRVKPGNGHLTVSWAAPVDDGGAPLADYVVTAEPGAHLCATTTLSCVVDDLDNGRAYDITVTASNTAGLTSLSSPSTTATPRTTPGPVTGITVTYQGSGSQRTAVIRWKAPVDDGGAAITRYRERWKRVGATYHSWSSSTKRVAKVPVKKGKTYRVQIEARNAAGYGDTTTVRLRF